MIIAFEASLSCAFHDDLVPMTIKFRKENLVEVECVFLRIQLTTYELNNISNDTEVCQNVLNGLSFSKHSNRISRIWREAEERNSRK